MAIAHGGGVGGSSGKAAGVVSAGVLTERFSEAVAWAAQLHRSQVRKGTEVPYVAHLLGVTSLVLEAGGDEDVAIAALLHDAVEDQGGLATLRLIEDRFGPDVARIVAACSDTVESPKPPALQRKQAYVRQLDGPDVGEDVLVVSAADKLHNLRSIVADHGRVGDMVWERFNLSTAQMAWYYSALADVYRRRLGGLLSQELDRSVEELKAILGI
jgi:(p)ppGpp synthase/HD superfamily hydrolase